MGYGQHSVARCAKGRKPGGERIRPVVVFDAYGTIWGAVVGDWASVRLRPHTVEVLRQLSRDYDLVLWTTAQRSNFDLLMQHFPDLAAVFTRIITRDDVPTDVQTYLPDRQQPGRISKDIRLVGGHVLIDDADDAIAEAQAFGFKLIRAPSILFESADQLAALDGDDWMPQLPRLIAEALAAPDAPAASSNGCRRHRVVPRRAQTDAG